MKYLESLNHNRRPIKAIITVLIPLVDVPGMGRTEILTGDETIIVPDVSVGDALIFSGSVWHRGTANLSNMPRYW